MAVTITVESPLQDEVRALITSLNAYLEPLVPPEFQIQLTAEQMAGEDTAVFVLRNDAGLDYPDSAYNCFYEKILP